MTAVKILGSGCAKCKTLHARVQELITQNNIMATVIKVEDLVEIMKYGILSTPGLVVNEQVKSAGSVPKDEQILAWLKEG
ncbi:MAG: thioredoxin family protein [Bacteroidetes bacterium]|nr:thioredoxin family protein [Bacteroidota bacterium]